MKTSSVLTSLLLSALAAAAPVQQRDLATKTEIVTETVVVYTTVWDDYVPSATAAPTKVASAPGGQFFEKPKPSSTLVAEVKPTTPKESAPAPPAYTPPPAAKPSTPAAPAPEPTTTVAPPAPSAPAPQPEKPSTTEAAPVLTTSLQQAAPVAPTQAAPAPAPSAGNSGSNSGGGGGSFSGEMTIYDAKGNLGACGKPIQDSDPVVALGKPTWGESTYDVMTGESSNPWCGKKINIHYEGKTTSATIMDLCPECKAGDIDLTPSLWKTVTGDDPKLGGRYQVSWTAA